MIETGMLDGLYYEAELDENGNLLHYAKEGEYHGHKFKATMEYDGYVQHSGRSARWTKWIIKWETMPEDDVTIHQACGWVDWLMERDYRIDRAKGEVIYDGYH